MELTTIQPARELAAVELSPVDRIAVLIADEVIPAWCVHYPASAARLDANLKTTARVYADYLSGRGLTIGDIRAGQRLLLEQDGEFAPKPAAFLDICRIAARQRQQAARPQSRPVISPAALRMLAESRLWCAGQPVTADAVAREVARVSDEKRAQGVQIGGEGWQ